MSQNINKPKRYSEQVNTQNDYEVMEHPQGVFVLYTDYAALAAENERLRKAGDRMAKLLSCAGSPPSEVADWLAAKEGRDAK